MKTNSGILSLLLLMIMSSSSSTLGEPTTNWKVDFSVNYDNLSTQVIDSPITFLKSFFRWYKVNYEYLDHQIHPIKVDFRGNNPYVINFKETEHYLSILKSSGYFSNTYIDNYRAYFIKIDSRLKKTKQNDGPVDGLDYDPIVHSQEADALLKNLDDIKMDVIKHVGNKLSMKIKTKYNTDTYLYYELITVNNKFLINKIQFFIDGVSQK